jgi:hypothetical protein
MAAAGCCAAVAAGLLVGASCSHEAPAPLQGPLANASAGEPLTAAKFTLAQPQSESDSGQPTLTAVAEAIAAGESGSMPTHDNASASSRDFTSAETPSADWAARNWEIRFSGQTLANYARELDQLGIELAVVLPKGQLLYASSLSSAEPKVRTGLASQEQRCYLASASSEVTAADWDALLHAQVEAQGRTVLKLLPPKVEQQLAQLERERAAQRIERVRKTRFGIREEAGGYAFYVLDQWYN